MEISDYLRALRRRLWIVVLIPLLAGGIVAAAVLLQPRGYTAKATVAAPAVVGGTSTSQYSGSTGVRAFVANFQAALTSPLIVNQVSQQTGVKPGTIQEGLASAPLGESSLVEVTYHTTQKANAVPIAQAASEQTIRFLFQTQVSLAQQTVDEARGGLEATEAELTKFTAENRVANAEREYETRSTEIANLRTDAARFSAEGNPVAAAAITETIKARQAELDTLQPKVAAYSALIQRRDQAGANLSLAQQQLQAAQAQFRAADPKNVVTLNVAKADSLLTSVASKAIPAAGAGLFLAIGVVVLLEILGRPRREEQVPPLPAAQRQRVPTRS